MMRLLAIRRYTVKFIQGASDAVVAMSVPVLPSAADGRTPETRDMSSRRSADAFLQHRRAA
jgi:hypothetical protein